MRYTSNVTLIAAAAEHFPKLSRVALAAARSTRQARLASTNAHSRPVRPPIPRRHLDARRVSSHSLLPLLTTPLLLHLAFALPVVVPLPFVPLPFVPLPFVPLPFVPLPFVPLPFVPLPFVPLPFVPLAFCSPLSLPLAFSSPPSLPLAIPCAATLPLPATLPCATSLPFPAALAAALMPSAAVRPSLLCPRAATSCGTLKGVGVSCVVTRMGRGGLMGKVVGGGGGNDDGLVSHMARCKAVQSGADGSAEGREDVKGFVGWGEADVALCELATCPPVAWVKRKRMIKERGGRRREGGVEGAMEQGELRVEGE
ncbi:unnamed protein product [Closterium sp. Naga37s-1]|nr:unnamed protein product [Closterium sp. Naga37s-1]